MIQSRRSVAPRHLLPGIVLLLGLMLAPSDARAQRCVLTDPLSIAKDTAQVLLRVSSIRTGRLFEDAVPLAGPDARCRLHVSPPSTAGEFDMEFTVAPVGSEARLQRTVQITSARPSAFAFQMEPVRVAGAAKAAARVAISQVSVDAGPAEYPLDVTATLENGHSETYRFSLVWTPPPRGFTATTSVRDCGSELCAMAGRDFFVALQGPQLWDLDTTGTSIVRTVLGNVARQDTLRIVGQAGAWGVVVPARPFGAGSLRMTIPVQIARLLPDGTKLRSFDLSEQALSVVTPLASEVAIYSDPELKTPLTSVRTGTNPVSVWIANPTSGPFLNGGVFQLKDPALGRNVAELRLNYTGSPRPGSVTPIAATVRRAARDGMAQLNTFSIADADVAIKVRLDVLPPITVTKALVEGQEGETGVILRPLDKATVRLEGPGISSIVKADLKGATTTIRSAGRNLDTVWIDLNTTQSIRTGDPLTLETPEGDRITLPIAVKPHNRPKQQLTYLFVEYDGKRDNAQVLARPGRRGVRSLRDVNLVFEPDSIDGERLYGVQYLKLDLSLRDADGNDRGHETRCVAVVPPGVNGVPYQVSGCTPVEGSLSLSSLLANSQRASAHARMAIRIAHDKDRYPGEQMPVAREVTLERGGAVIWEVQSQLPTGMLAFNGRSIAPAMSYTAAMISVRPYLANLWGTHSLAFQGGFALPTATNQSGGANLSASQLALSGGMSYTLADMAGARLELRFGPMWPLTGRGFRSRDLFWVLQPGVTLNREVK